MSYRVLITDETERDPNFNMEKALFFLVEAANKSWAQCKEYLDSAVPKPGDNQCWQHTDLRDGMIKQFEFNPHIDIPDFFPVCRLCGSHCSVTQCFIATGCDGEFWWDKAPNFSRLNVSELLLLIIAMINYRSKFWKKGNSVTTQAEKLQFGAKKRKLIEATLQVHSEKLSEMTFLRSQLSKEMLDCDTRFKYADEMIEVAMGHIKAAEAKFLKGKWYALLKPLWPEIVFYTKVKINSFIQSENRYLYRYAAQEGLAISERFASTCEMLCTVACDEQQQGGAAGSSSEEEEDNDPEAAPTPPPELQLIIAQTFCELGKWAQVLQQAVETSSLTTHISSASELMQLVAPPAWKMLLELFTTTGLNSDSLAPLLGVLVGTPFDQNGIEREMKRRLFS